MKEQEKQTCDNCTNKYLCPNFNKNGACMGWGDREVFIGLIKLTFAFMLPEKYIDDKFAYIKYLQEEKKEQQ